MKQGCLIMLAWLIGLFIVSAIFEAIFGLSGRIIARIVALVIAFAYMPKLFREARLQKQIEAVPAIEILSKDKRAPILFLRSFKEDGGRKDVPAMNLIQPLISPYGVVNDQTPTFEEEIARYVESIGPFITFSDRNHGLPELGAARLHAERENWRSVLEDLFVKCRLVILRAGETESLLWELSRIVNLVPAERVIIYLQIGTEVDIGVQQARYNRFKRLIDPLLPHALPTTRGKNQILYFTNDWKPVLARNLRKALKEKQIPFENFIRYKLKKLLPYAYVNTEVYCRDQIYHSFASRLGILRKTDVSKSSARKTIQHLAQTLDLSTKTRLEQRNLKSTFLYQILLTISGVLYALICGSLYGFTNRINPEPLLDVVPLFVLSCLIGILIGLTGRYIRLYGGLVYSLNGILAGSVFIFAKWVIWLYIGFDEMILDPRGIFEMLSFVVAYVDGQTGEGSLLWGMMIAEASFSIFLIILTSWIYGLSKTEYIQAIDRRDYLPERQILQ